MEVSTAYLLCGFVCVAVLTWPVSDLLLLFAVSYISVVRDLVLAAKHDVS